MTDQQYQNAALRIILTRPWAFWCKFDDWLLDNLDIQRADLRMVMNYAHHSAGHLAKYAGNTQGV